MTKMQPKKASNRERKRADNRTHGVVVREAREAQGKTLRQLAKATGLSAPFLSDVEHGRRRLTGDTLAKVAKALKIPVGALQRVAMFDDVEARYPELAEILKQKRDCGCPCCEVYGGR
jgi:transcriptional regulator with XRE-family HTH domain